jgi:hypothetical protein
MAVRDQLLGLLLAFTIYDNNEIRSNSILIVKTLHEKDDFRNEIEVGIYRLFSIG